MQNMTGFLFWLQLVLQIEFKLGQEDHFVYLVLLLSQLNVLIDMVFVYETSFYLLPHIYRDVWVLHFELFLGFFWNYESIRIISLLFFKSSCRGIDRGKQRSVRVHIWIVYWVVIACVVLLAGERILVAWKWLDLVVEFRRHMVLPALHPWARVDVNSIIVLLNGYHRRIYF